MSFRSLKTLSTWTLALAVGFATTSSFAAGKKDKEALKLHDQAMDEDYLSLELDKAEEKLQKALKACGKDACSGPVVGKLWVALATVHGVGQQKLDVAKGDLVNALKADPGAKLLDGLTTPELEAKFSEAKAEAGGGGSTEPAPPDGGEPETPKPAVGGDFNHTPLAESAVHTPVPIFAEIPEELGATKVVLRYKPYGGTKWVSLTLEAMEGGFGGEVPCDAVTTSGELKYYIIGTDDTGTPVATAGSTKNPYKIPIKNKISGDAPSLPGKKPPARCQAKEDCPPGLPGCAADGGGKAEGALCDSLAECASGLTCSSDGVCVPGGDDDDDGPSKGGKNLVSIGAQIDLALISSAEGVCNASSSATFACFRQDSGDQFYGFPAEVNGTNGIAGGLGLGGVRLLAGYDRFLFDGLGLAVGARAGFALGGSPTPQTSPPNGDINGDDVPDYAVPPQALSYLPLHLEGRASYHFLGEGNVEAGQLRPFAFVGGGIAQVNASVPVTVCDLSVEGGSGACPGETTVDAYQLTGLGFVGFGGGATYMIVDNFGVSAEVKFMIMLPTTGFVISPVIAPVVAF